MDTVAVCAREYVTVTNRVRVDDCVDNRTGRGVAGCCVGGASLGAAVAARRVVVTLKVTWSVLVCVSAATRVLLGWGCGVTGATGCLRLELTVREIGTVTVNVETRLRLFETFGAGAAVVGCAVLGAALGAALGGALGAGVADGGSALTLREAASGNVTVDVTRRTRVAVVVRGGRVGGAIVGAALGANVGGLCSDTVAVDCNAAETVPLRGLEIVDVRRAVHVVVRKPSCEMERVVWRDLVIV